MKNVMIFFSLTQSLCSVRRRNAARKRKLNVEEKSKSTDTEDDSTFDDEGLSQKEMDSK